jgi:hypothetical protein
MPLPLPMRHTAFPPTAGPMQLPVAQPTPPAALNLNPKAVAALLAQLQAPQQLPVGLPAVAVVSVPEAMPMIDPTLELMSKIDLLHNCLDDLEKQTAGNKSTTAILMMTAAMVTMKAMVIGKSMLSDARRVDVRSWQNTFSTSPANV